MSSPEYLSKRRRRLKAEGKCIDCGKEAFRDSARCLMCLEKNCMSGHLYRMQNRRKLADESKEKRHQWILEGRCIRCGSLLIESEGRYCMWCKAGRHQPVIRGVV